MKHSEDEMENKYTHCWKLENVKPRGGGAFCTSGLCQDRGGGYLDLRPVPGQGRPNTSFRKQNDRFPHTIE